MGRWHTRYNLRLGSWLALSSRFLKPGYHPMLSSHVSTLDIIPFYPLKVVIQIYHNIFIPFSHPMTLRCMLSTHAINSCYQLLLSTHYRKTCSSQYYEPNKDILCILNPFWFATSLSWILLLYELIQNMYSIVNSSLHVKLFVKNFI
jgi:hypothetical protein